MRGIYKIQNKINNKVYIGESLDILRRWQEHIHSLNSNSHHSYKLQNDWNEYGEDNFTFSIVSVLDDTISNFVDRYVLIIFEAKYITHFDSINNGYNIEFTFDAVMNENKVINSGADDKRILKVYKERISEKIIEEFGGIIYSRIYTMKDLADELNLELNTELKGLLFNNNFLLKIACNTYILNENIINKKDLVNNKTYSKIKFKENVFVYLLECIRKIIENKSGIYNTKISKTSKGMVRSENIKVKNDKPIPQVTGSVPNSMKDFISKYRLNIYYNDVFLFLRENNILKYITINDKNYNTPTEEYEKYFIINKKINPEGQTYPQLIITDEGKTVLEKILIDANVISYK